MIHPVWCLQDGCEERGWHEGTELRCNADPTMDVMEFFVVPEGERVPLDEAPEIMIVRAVVVQSLHSRHPALEIRSYDVPEAAEVAILTPQQARLLGEGLPGLLRLMDGGSQ